MTAHPGGSLQFTTRSMQAWSRHEWFRVSGLLAAGSGGVNVYWVAVKKLKLGYYYIGKILLFTRYAHHGHLI